MRLRITDQDSVLIEDICQNQEVYFWDSSFCTSRLTNWGLRISDSLHPSVYLLDTVINYFVNTYDSVNDTPLVYENVFHFISPIMGYIMLIYTMPIPSFAGEIKTNPIRQ